MDKIYAKINGKLQGPFKGPQLVELARAGTIGPKTRLSRDCLKWFSAKRVRDLFSAAELAAAEFVPDPTPVAAVAAAEHSRQPEDQAVFESFDVIPPPMPVQRGRPAETMVQSFAPPVLLVSAAEASSQPPIAPRPAETWTAVVARIVADVRRLFRVYPTQTALALLLVSGGAVTLVGQMRQPAFEARVQRIEPAAAVQETAAPVALPSDAEVARQAEAFALEFLRPTLSRSAKPAMVSYQMLEEPKVDTRGLWMFLVSGVVEHHPERKNSLRTMVTIILSYDAARQAWERSMLFLDEKPVAGTKTHLGVVWKGWQPARRSEWTNDVTVLPALESF